MPDTNTEVPLQRIEKAQKLYYFHTEQIGTPLEFTASEGWIVSQATYRSWGRLSN
ncbi:hypothetical protein PPUJ20005_53550 [Pseudomonas putida]|nr:hypothetical protein PPUJ20005_53550 [Pseudomonas putida]